MGFQKSIEDYIERFPEQFAMLKNLTKRKKFFENSLHKCLYKQHNFIRLMEFVNAIFNTLDIDPIPESSFIFFRMIEFPHSLFEDFCNKVKSTQVSNLSKLLIIENFKKFSKIKLVSKFFSQVQKLAKKYAQVSEKSSKTTPELNLNKKKRLSIKDLQSELLKYGHEKDQEELKSLQNELYAFIIVEIKNMISISEFDPLNEMFLYRAELLKFSLSRKDTKEALLNFILIEDPGLVSKISENKNTIHPEGPLQLKICNMMASQGYFIKKGQNYVKNF